jgi:Zn-dependent M28 family amino/carboxypeptidase
MKTYFCMYLLMLGLTGCSDRPARAREFSGDTAMKYVHTQMEFGPRIPNTEGHLKTGDWIIERLKATADSVEVQSFTHVTTKNETLKLRNIIGRFKPNAPDRILFLAHWDTRPKAEKSPNLADQQRPVPGANDGASGVAVLLAMADALKQKAPTLGVDLLFVDGEDYGDFTENKDVLLGSRYYAEHLPATKPLFAVLLDMVGDSDLGIYQEGYSVANAPEVVQRVWTLAEEMGYGRIFKPSVGYSLDDDHMPLQQAGIHAIDVIDFDFPAHHTTQDTEDKVSAKSLGIVGDVALALTR